MSQETVTRDDSDVRERRRHERYAVEGDAEVIVAGGTLLFRGSIADISLSGCFIETRARLLEMADKCPVHRTLKSEVDIRTVEKPTTA